MSRITGIGGGKDFPETIVDQGTSISVALTSPDLMKVHLLKNVAAGLIYLPPAIAGDIGKWVELRKRAAGDIRIDADGTDVIEVAAYLNNTEAAEIWAWVRLKILEIGKWGYDGHRGTWTGTASSSSSSSRSSSSSSRSSSSSSSRSSSSSSSSATP